MSDDTTMKIDKKVLNKLHGVRGHLDYMHPPKKHTLNDAVDFLVDMYRKKHKGGSLIK